MGGFKNDSNDVMLKCHVYIFLQIGIPLLLYLALSIKYVFGVIVVDSFITILGVIKKVRFWRYIC